jgi:hypothetical protein
MKHGVSPEHIRQIIAGNIEAGEAKVRDFGPKRGMQRHETHSK